MVEKGFWLLDVSITNSYALSHVVYLGPWLTYGFGVLLWRAMLHICHPFLLDKLVSQERGLIPSMEIQSGSMESCIC